MNICNKYKIVKSIFKIALYIVPSYALANSDILFLSGFEKYQIQLNDTGINWGADFPVGNNLTCSSNLNTAQDCHQGRDFTHPDNSDGLAGFSYVKLDSNGVPLIDQTVLYADSPWDCIKDNVTGLIWEVKTTDGSVHDKDNTYKWGGIGAIGKNHPNREGDYFDDWNILVTDSNDNNLCGLSNWRVPTLLELSSISNKAESYPSIDTRFFPNTVASGYWSTYPFTNGTSAWVIRFEFSLDADSSRNALNRVRLVNSEQ